MKFVSVASAKGLKVGEPVYTLNEAGEYGAGKLKARLEFEDGLEFIFEVPQYFNKERPAINPVVAKDITHVSLMRNKKNEDDV
jgi:hypothetical protein